jgi:hypothetical protein
MKKTGVDEQSVGAGKKRADGCDCLIFSSVLNPSCNDSFGRLVDLGFDLLEHSFRSRVGRVLRVGSGPQRVLVGQTRTVAPHQTLEHIRTRRALHTDKQGGTERDKKKN